MSLSSPEKSSSTSEAVVMSSRRLSKILQHVRSPSSVSMNSINASKTSSNVKYSLELQSLPNSRKLKGKTVFMSGGSRGIGLALALKFAEHGCNITIAAKTAHPHPKLPGTIYTAAKEIEAKGVKALAVVCDIRSETAVKAAVEKCVQMFGGIDIVINNASAISLTNTERTSMKKFDLMHAVNARGTFLVTKFCIPYLKKSENGHILTMCPPMGENTEWISNFLAYSISKMGMSLCCLGWSKELKKYGIASNGLWPKTAIATAAVNNLLGGEAMMNRSRTCDIMADSAYLIVTQDSRSFTGNFIIDEDILRCAGVKDFSKYRVNQNMKESDLIVDGFITSTV